MDKLSRLAQVVAGRMSGPDAGFSGFAIDTRRINRGEVFVALAGEKVDGHEFVAMAARQGAAGALVARWQDVDLPQVVVPDVLAALQDYARDWRQQFDLPLIGVTGSNGKTTTKEMLAAILGQAGPVLATRGNFNNHIGMPLTLCELGDEHRMAVIEMGANHPGEIAELAAIAAPNAAIVTLAGAAHLEGFGSVEEVARTKGAMYEALPEQGLAVINNDDAYAGLWRQMAAHCRQLSFGLQPGADVTAQDISGNDSGGSCFMLHSPMGSVAVSIPLPGRHNVMNALGAAAVSLGLGLTPAQVDSGLGGMQAVAGRLRIVPGLHGARIVDDSYNANPVSVKAAIDWLAGQSGRRWLALGDMAELGADAPRWHREVGEQARAAGLDRLLGLGPLSREAVAGFGTGATHYESQAVMIAALGEALADDVTLLVKGSRSAQMEQVVAGLAATPSQQAANGG